MLKIILFLVIFVGGISYGLTKLTPKLPQQASFAAGKLPDPKLDGDYKGSALFTGPWKGKTFNSKKQTGENLVFNNGKVVKMFPFKSYEGNGIHDPKVKVLDLDYNISGNPFYIKPILDEVVQTNKNHYLGKLNLRLIPNHPFTLGFFTLEK